MSNSERGSCAPPAFDVDSYGPNHGVVHRTQRSAPNTGLVAPGASNTDLKSVGGALSTSGMILGIPTAHFERKFKVVMN